MDKITYLAELAEGLARWVPERDRQDILRYYAEYFEEAGPDREGEVVAELGDPWALSCRLAVEGGFVTQEAANSWTPPKRKRRPWALAGTLAAIAIVGVSAAFLFSQVGGLVGKLVGVSLNQVTENEEVALIGTDKVVSGVTIHEGDTAGGFWTMQDGCLEQFNTIDVEVGLANVTVTVANDYTLFIDQSANMNYELKWEVKGGTLKIRDGGSSHFNVNSWGELRKLFDGGLRATEVNITVPETLLEKVSIKTGTGNVFVSGVFAKKVEAETGLGNVECYELRQVKKLDLESGTGNVTLVMDELYDGLDIDLESGIGNVEATLGCREEDCGYELESGIGAVSVNGADRGKKAERKGKTSYKLDSESGTGNVTVQFYDSSWQ